MHTVHVWARCSGKYAFEICDTEGRTVEGSRYIYGSYEAAERAGLKRAERWDEKAKEAV